MTVVISTEKCSSFAYNAYIGVGRVVPSMTAVNAYTRHAKAVPCPMGDVRIGPPPQGESRRLMVWPLGRGIDVKMFTDEEMQHLLTTSRGYSAVILRKGANYGSDGSDAAVWEHGRHNFALRDARKLAIVCPVM